MIARFAGAAVMAGIIAACGNADDSGPSMAPANEEVARAIEQVDLACQPTGMPLEDRPSPYDSVMVTIGDSDAKLCYGRPSARDRNVFGVLVPYDTLWRTGANEPTTIHLPVAAEIAGLRVDPGSYTIYTVPGRNEWTVIVNRSTSQWGIETQYTDEVRAQEVGRARVPAESTADHVETFTISTEEVGASTTNLVLEWENTRVRIPVERM